MTTSLRYLKELADLLKLHVETTDLCDFLVCYSIYLSLSICLESTIHFVASTYSGQDSETATVLNTAIHYFFCIHHSVKQQNCDRNRESHIGIVTARVLQCVPNRIGNK